MGEWDGTERRAKASNNELVAEIVRALKSEEKDSPLTHEEEQWVRLAIQREAQSIKLRQAIIEKTLAGLVWAGVVGIGVLLLEWARAHGLKI